MTQASISSYGTFDHDTPLQATIGSTSYLTGGSLNVIGTGGKDAF